MTRARPVHGDRSLENLALVFRDFGEFEAPQLGAYLYEALCPAIAEDFELLEVVVPVPASQPPPNLLFGAVHYLLLDDEPAPLRRYYRDLGGPPKRSGATDLEVDAAPPVEAYAPFRNYVLDHREQIEELLRTRRVQTNVIQRCTALVPAFATIAARDPGRPLAVIEVGASAGLNLRWDRYGYRYQEADLELARWGDPASAVQLTAEVRGDRTPPMPADVEVAWSAGLELDPVDIEDPDAVRWLRALIWPEHIERHARLEAAIAIGRHDPPRVVAGDATTDLAALLAEAPAAPQLCVFATHALYQIPRKGQEQIFEAMRVASGQRSIAFVTMEGTGVDYSELFLHWYEDGERSVTHLANCNPHGRWIEWFGS